MFQWQKTLDNDANYYVVPQSSIQKFSNIIAVITSNFSVRTILTLIQNQDGVLSIFRIDRGQMKVELL